MNPEQMLAIEGMVGELESLLNSFADATTRIKQRMIEAGWTQENAEAFAIATSGTLTAGLMGQLSAPAVPELELMEQVHPSALMPALLGAFSSAICILVIALIVGWVF